MPDILHKPKNVNHKRKDDAHSRMLARKDLTALHRNDLALSDLHIIARLTGNRELENLVLEAST